MTSSATSIPANVFLSMIPRLGANLGELLTLKEVCKDWREEADLLAKEKLAETFVFPLDTYPSFTRESLAPIPLAELRHRMSFASALRSLRFAIPFETILGFIVTPNLRETMETFLRTCSFEPNAMAMRDQHIYTPAFLREFFQSLGTSTPSPRFLTAIQERQNYQNQAPQTEEPTNEREWEDRMLGLSEPMVQSLIARPSRFMTTVRFLRNLHRLEMTHATLFGMKFSHSSSLTAPLVIQFAEDIIFSHTSFFDADQHEIRTGYNEYIKTIIDLMVDVYGSVFSESHEEPSNIQLFTNYLYLMDEYVGRLEAYDEEEDGEDEDTIDDEADE